MIDDANSTQFGRAIGAEARRPKYEHMDVMRSAHLRNKHGRAGGKRERGGSGRSDRYRHRDGAEGALLASTHASAGRAALSDVAPSRTAMTFSDSGAHVSQIVDCSIQTYLLA